MIVARKNAGHLIQRMRWEVVDRSITGVLPVLILNCITIFFPFGRKIWGEEIRAISALLVVFATWRIIVVRDVIKRGEATASEYRKVLFFVIGNTLLWGFSLSLSLFDMVESKDFSIFAIGALLGFATGGLSTLGISARLYTFYLACMDGFPMIALLLSEFVFHRKVDNGFFLIFTIIVIYSLREASGYRRRVTQAHLDQIRLEIRNHLLVRSRQELVEQTSRNVHSSRLASLGEMAGGVAHEINNPLAIIDLNLDSMRTVLEEDGSVSGEFAIKGLQRCQASVLRITKIVRGLRNFSRSGEKDPLERVAVSRIIEETLDFCREKIRAHEIDFQVQGDTKFEVHCRPVEISQILVNLVNNAYDVVADLPRESRFIRFEVASHENQVLLKVVDSGPPLTHAVKEKFFQPFFTTKPIGAGTGLGLSISKAIAKNHGGDLFLDIERENTTFVLRLPLAV